MGLFSPDEKLVQLQVDESRSISQLMLQTNGKGKDKRHEQKKPMHLFGRSQEDEFLGIICCHKRTEVAR